MKKTSILLILGSLPNSVVIVFIESFNSIFRTTFLNRWCFLTLAEMKALTR